MNTVLIYLLVAGILTCVLAMFVVASRASGPSLRNLPDLEPAEVLTKKEAALSEDLVAVAAKIGCVSMPKIPLGWVVTAKDAGIRKSWHRALLAEYVDFVLVDPKNNRPMLAILPSGGGRAESRDPAVLNALDAASIAYIQLGNYNLAGLEKAVKERLSSTEAKGRQGRKRKAPSGLFQNEEPPPDTEAS